MAPIVHAAVPLGRWGRGLEGGLDGIAKTLEPQYFLPVFAKNGASTRSVRRDLHLGQAGERPACSEIRCTTANRLRHFSHR